MKLPLLCVNIQLVLQEPLGYSLHMSGVLSRIFGVDQNVIKVNKYKTIQEISQYIINQVLENSRGIGEPEGHYQVFKIADGGFECGLPFVPLLDSVEVVCVAEIQFCENLGIL